MLSLPYQLRCGLHSWRGVGGWNSEQWVCYGSRLPAPGDPSAKLLPSEPANQDLSPGKASPCQFRAAAQPWSQARAGQGVPVLPEVGGEEPGRLAAFHFLCLQNGFLGCRQHGAGASRQSRLQSPRSGRMWLSLGEISLCPAQPSSSSAPGHSLMTSL